MASTSTNKNPPPSYQQNQGYPSQRRVRWSPVNMAKSISRKAWWLDEDTSNNRYVGGGGQSNYSDSSSLSRSSPLGNGGGISSGRYRYNPNPNKPPSGSSPASFRPNGSLLRQPSQQRRASFSLKNPSDFEAASRGWGESGHPQYGGQNGSSRNINRSLHSTGTGGGLSISGRGNNAMNVSSHNYSPIASSSTHRRYSIASFRAGSFRSSIAASEASKSMSYGYGGMFCGPRWWKHQCCTLCGLGPVLHSLFRVSEESRRKMRATIESRSWSFGMVLMTPVLLFGSSVQNMWFPKGSDPYFDGLFLIAFLFMFFDLVLKCFSYPDYCKFQFCRRDCRADSTPNYQYLNSTQGGGGGDAMIRKKDGCCCGMINLGSFLFWCDFISTWAMLYEISYVNVDLNRIRTNGLMLNPIGIPTSDDLANWSWSRFQAQTLITIARTVRVGGFIRPSTVTKTSSMINWYSLTKRLDPCYWLGCKGPHHRDIMSSHDNDGSSTTTGASNTNTSTSHHHGPGVDSRDGSTNSPFGSNRSTLLSVFASTYSSSGSIQHKFHYRSILRFLGYRSREDITQRNKAATKIQRAYRAYIVRNNDDDDGNDPNSHPAKKKFKLTAATSFIPSSVKYSLRMRTNLAATNMSTAAARLRSESQVGNAMRDLTAQRVVLGMIFAFILVSVLTWRESDDTRLHTMVVLHHQTMNVNFGGVAIEAARSGSIPTLFEYMDVYGNVSSYDIGYELDQLREREKLMITVVQPNYYTNSTTGVDYDPADSVTTFGYFSIRQESRDVARTNLLFTLFVILIWYLGVTAFAGPVMTLVVIPIERMIRLLGMLMRDPLGYQTDPKYRKFAAEEDHLTKHTMWTKSVLTGMETSFLMSTILRIGSLMKVGFGSAGVEIIRSNLEKGQKKDVQFMNTKGSTVSCIFLFCDIRQFTDATECLQEEVFVFTNKIAAVVHSYCHAYGGSANKNIGDAFLVSWLLDDRIESQNEFDQPERNFLGGAMGGNTMRKRYSSGFSPDTSEELYAYNNQADKCLLSVVKVCIALHHDKFYLEPLGENAKSRLLKKLSKRKGPVVQMGFGLHAGKAVQGAIGSQRKIDATYVSEAVERCEYLESSTKKFGLKMLMSDSFHTLLHSSNRRRCRKVDQIVLRDEDDDVSDTEDFLDASNVMELWTFDMDIDALWRSPTPASSHNGLDITESSSHGGVSHGVGNVTDSDSNFRSHGSSATGMSSLDAPMSSSSKRDVLKWSRRGSNMGPDGMSLAAAKASKTRRRVSFMAGSNLVNKGLSSSGHGGFGDGANDRRAERGGSGVGPGGGGLSSMGDSASSSHSNGPVGTPSTSSMPTSPGLSSSATSADDDKKRRSKPDHELVLPTGLLPYIPAVWLDEDMRKIRQRYSDSLFPFLQKFNAGLQSYYSRDWDHARQCFQTILERFEDGPSRYFLNKIEENNGVPPRNFSGYGVE